MGRKLDRASRVKSPYTRQRASLARMAASEKSASGVLSSSAGHTRATIEQLERRQMLFALAVSANDVNPQTGLGTVRGFFGYTIPYLNTKVVLQPAQPPTAINENFSNQVYGPVNSGAFFAGSGIRSFSNITPPNDYAITAAPPTADNQNRWLRVKEDAVGEFFTFEFWSPADNPVRQTRASQAQITIAPDGAQDNTGLLSDNMKVELLAGEGAAQTVVATFTGQALLNLIQGGANPQGVGTFVFNAPADVGAFDDIRVTMTSVPPGGRPEFRVTNVNYTTPQGRFTGVIDSRIFGAEVVLTGPVGATATFLNAYNEDMRETIALGKPTDSPIDLVDINDDGIPDFNDGIGAIRFTGTDSRTSFSIWGGKIEATTTAPPNADDFDGQFAFTVTDDLKGLYDDFETAGYAFMYDVTNGQIRFTGMPPGPGSVIIGSPFVRDRANYNPAGAFVPPNTPVTTGFTDASQGLFIDDGQPISGIYIHGILNGSSRFTNFVDKIYVGYLMGSINVDGDLGTLTVGTDAAMWAPDASFTQPNRGFKTGGQLLVGRTVGSIDIAGRSLLDVTVVGDLNNPSTRPARDVFNYYEKEFIYGLDTTATAQTDIRRTLSNNDYVTRATTDLDRPDDQNPVFGAGFFRNDTIMGAEWVGSISSGVRITGELSGRDPLNGEDTDDIYAFAVDGTQTVTVQGETVGNPAPLYFRIMDQDGRTLAAPQATATGIPTQFSFKPTNGPGVYYLVVTDPNGSAETGFGNQSYTVAITGMAVATLGAYRTGASNGFIGTNGTSANSIIVLNGNIGTLRIGTGWSDGAGGEADPTQTFNTDRTAGDAMSFAAGSFSTPGSLYNITLGSDMGAASDVADGSVVSIRVGGDLGTFFTGLSQTAGGSVNQGDVNFFSLTVGGRIASMDIRGGIGMDQDAADPRFPVSTGGLVAITSGSNGGNGDIGFIRVGFHVAAGTLSIHTSPHSTVGALLISQDAYNDPDPRSGVYLQSQNIPVGTPSINFITGAGSDVRFVDIPRIDLPNSNNVLTPLIAGQPATIVDDDGSRVTINIEGGADGTLLGAVRVIPIEGSQGVAIGEITANLTGGAVLHVTGVNAGGGGVVSIGRIVLTGGDTGSQVLIDGNVKVDVYRVDAPFAMDALSNTSGGDIVAADVTSLNSLTVNGDLGRTNVPSFGPQNIGPQLGVVAGLAGAVGGGLGLPLVANGSIDNDFAGGIFRPVTDDNVLNNTAFLDDLGSPIDGQLNGIVVRTGGVTEVNVKGAIGDIILQDATGTLQSVVANSDHITPLGRFDGIVGNIFAANIGTVDVGDGLAPSDGGPFATTGIVSANDIVSITSSRASGAIISGNINALNSVDDVAAGNPDAQDGIGTVTFHSAQVVDARIASEFLDGFWNSFNGLYDDIDDPTGNIANVNITDSKYFRTAVTGINLGTLSLTNTTFDASTVRMTGTIQQITATAYKNSTLDGGLNELHDNSIESARDVNRITATTDMQDLTIDITGSVTGSLSAVNFTRTSINVDGELKSITASNDFRASTIVAGSLPSMTAARNIQSSTIDVSGPVGTISAADHIANTTIDVTGPDGSIGTITGRTLVSGAISASGPIGTITVTAGDLAATITTTTGAGTVGTLSASRDLDIVTDLSAGVSSLIAGRNVGSPTVAAVILVRGDLGSLTAPGGQLYSDLRVSGTIGTVTLGGATDKIGNVQVGEGSIISFSHIGTVTVGGDFGGDIISYTGGIGSVAITNGSLLPGNTIAAYDGSLTSVTITNGSLYGNVHADYDITLLRVAGAADGVFGDIGINPGSNPLASYDALRNQLPAGVTQTAALDGPTISAGKNIVSIQVTNGSVFETTFTAGRAINNITISGRTADDNISTGTGTVFAAGDSIDAITIGGGVSHTAFIAGLVSLGADGRAGGVGADADTIKSGTIKLVTISNGVSDSSFTAGMVAGLDGVYNTADDQQVFGISSIQKLTLSGTVTNTSAFSDQLATSVANDGRLIRGGTNLSVTNVPTFPGEPAANATKGVDTGGNFTIFSGSHTFNNIHGANVTFNFSGPGTALFDAANARLILRGTTTGSNLTVSSSTGSISDFDIVSSDDASMGKIDVQANLTGDSDVIVDGNVTTLTFKDVASTGVIAIGGDVTTATFNSLTGGYFSARTVATMKINGAFGNTNSAVFNEARIDLLSGGTIAITGPTDAVISVDRDLTSLTLTGAVDRSAFRFGNSIGTLATPNLSRTVVSAGDTIGTVTIGGDMFQSIISAGADLGTDGLPGGTGSAADTVSTGFITSITIAGGIPQSSITAGYLRGPDGYFGTSDDSVAAGRSTIGTITVAGATAGSSRNSESYRIASSGSLGTIMIGGAPFNGFSGNFGTEAPNLAPQSIQVTDIKVDVVSRVSTAHIIFDQPMNASTISAALSVSEVRGSGDVTIRLVEGIDYTVAYDPATNSADVTFSTSVTERNLPTVPGKPGPGIYRFELDQNIIRAKLTGVRMDGNGDGFATPGDNFSGDSIVGDAGDINSTTGDIAQVGTNGALRVDRYPPVNLDIVMDNNFHSDGLPDPNTTYTVRGFIGDHPDNDTNFFRFAGDVDLYKITLQAGQVLQLGALQGTALLADFSIFDPNGVQIVPGGENASVVSLPVALGNPSDPTQPSAYLVKVTGTYLIAVGNATDINTPGAVPNPDPTPSALGDYSFTVGIFDDGDSGFNGSTDAANGDQVVNAPDPIAFAGPDGVFGTSDDLTTISSQGYTFTLSKGLDGLPNTADDLVSGDNGNGIVSTKTGTGQESSTITSAIGPKGHNGAPTDIVSDVDVFHLNGGNPIAPGTRMTVTVKLADLGANLGSASPLGENNRGATQFAIFDDSNSTAIDDANMVFSPTDFSPLGGTPNTLIADNGATRYGYDANGDFFVSFVVPDRQGAPGASGTFAVYIQGTNNTDYQIKVDTDPTNTTTLPLQHQNILIETNGGSVNWLQAGGLTTTFAPFNANTLGFTGNVNGVAVQTYILNQLVASLNGLFGSAGGGGTGFSVTFSTNPSDFEFQPFSTVFLTSSADPLLSLFTSQPYGFSQHSDPFNTNLEDEAVVFVPSFALQGLTPGTTDVNRFVQSLTAAVGRRAGELMGLRVTQAYPAASTNFDVFAANSVDQRPPAGQAYSILNNGRILSDPFDTVTRSDFFLGRQNARSLLEQVLQPV